MKKIFVLTLMLIIGATTVNAQPIQFQREGQEYQHYEYERMADKRHERKQYKHELRDPEREREPEREQRRDKTERHEHEHDSELIPW